MAFLHKKENNLHYKNLQKWFNRNGDIKLKPLRIGYNKPILYNSVPIWHTFLVTLSL
jgi:hypothetical protein